MRKKGFVKFISLFLVYMMIAGSMYVLPAKAGSSKNVIDNTSFEKELDTSIWNNPNGDIMIENGSLVFGEDSTEVTSLITRTNVKNGGFGENLLNTEVQMQFTSLPQGEIFALCFGLGSVEALMGEPGNVEVQFQNNGGLQVGVKAYDSDGNAAEVAKPTSCGSIGEVKVEAAISAESILTLYVGGKKICQAELPVSGEGRIGFLQTGSCAVKISNVQIATYEYDRPENCDIYEDFEGEAINANLLTAKMVYPSNAYSPCRMVIEEIDGNRALCFQNTGPSYIGTMHKYSNFEITFDVVQLQKNDEKNEDGKVTKPRNTNLGISFGDELKDYSGYGYLTSADMLLLEGDSLVRSFKTELTASAKDKGYPYYSSTAGRPFTVRMSVIDSVITLEMKWVDEDKFTEIMQYQLSESTPTGYIHIWTTSTTANFAIDNLSIVNKDKDPNLMEVEYKSALVVKPEDYQYNPMEKVYQEKTEETVFNVYLIIPAVATLCIVALLVTAFVELKRRTKNKRREGAGNEN